jgi:protoheme IX farnesyltransferase
MNNITTGGISDYLQLCRPGIALFAMLTAGCSFMLAGPQNISIISSLLAGVFVLASGASCLNQYQERTTDALMARTKERPIPSGRLSPLHTLYFALAAMIAGLSILYAYDGLISAAIGLFAVVWYNGVYTYLKRKSAFAVVPGGLTGALIPAIGWAAGGGSLADPRLLALCIFFGLWQVPHFWLLVFDHGREYEEAGFPSLTQIFRPAQITRITFTWITATAVCGPMLCLFSIAHTSIAQYLILAVSIWLFWQGGRFMVSNGKDSRLFFVKINVYMIAIIALLCCDSLYLRSIDVLSGVVQ